MKNVVFLTSVKSKMYSEKYGGYEWMDISKRSWEYWCEKNNCILYQYDTPSQSHLKEFRVTWQRWFDVYDELEKNNIDYDKILVVDACSIVKWNCPNFFKLVDDRMTAWHDKDNLGWIYQSVVGYSKFFKQFEHNLSHRTIINNYINAGSVIINKNHKKFFKTLKELYYQHKTELLDLQDHTVKKGTDQTPFNYWLQINNVNINRSLPFMYNLTHMHRKNMFTHNWQLEEQGLPHFIKHGYVWKYNGIPKNQRTSLMKQTWKLVNHFYKNTKSIEGLLSNIPDKKQYSNTTSIKFKKDLFNFFVDTDSKKMKILELGTNHGHTTRILAALFEKVYTFDHLKSNLSTAKMLNYDFSNIDYYEIDIYNERWPQLNFDVVFIDCMHTYETTKHDINTALKYSAGKSTYFVFDDYGLGWGPNSGQVKQAVDEFVNKGFIKILKEIGHSKGVSVGDDRILCDTEGLICISTGV